MVIGSRTRSCIGINDSNIKGVQRELGVRSESSDDIPLIILLGKQSVTWVMSHSLNDKSNQPETVEFCKSLLLTDETLPSLCRQFRMALVHK